MVPYDRVPVSELVIQDKSIASFVSSGDLNSDKKTVESFGQEWDAFDQFDANELKSIGNEYFDIIGPAHLDKSSLVLDVGCGTGRWSRYISEKVRFVEAIDPSNAVVNAVKLTGEISNIRISQAGVDSIPFADETFDFVLSLGVLHHIPDTAAAMRNCVEKAKIGGHFLVYLYYSLDNRGWMFKSLFHCSNLLRRGISKLPFGLKKFCCNVIALTVYLPLARTGTLFSKILPKRSFYKKLPLFYYSNKSFYIMRNDALDRFGTPLEQRFSKTQIRDMMANSGLTDIVFSEKTPYWHAVGKRTW